MPQPDSVRLVRRSDVGTVVPPVANPTFTGVVTAPGLKLTTGMFASAILTVDGSGNIVAIGRSLGLPWDPEMVLNSGTLVSGYNDLPGGLMVNNPYSTGGIYLEAVAVRLADPVATVQGSGNLLFEVFVGSATASETTLAISIQIAAGGHDVIATLPTSLQVAHNAVIRVKVTLGSTQVYTPVHVQLRGKYA